LSSPSRPQRLRKPAEFAAVFSTGKRLRGRAFTIIALRREEPPARLGLAVGKRASKLSVERNRIKRLVRESFRAQTLPSCWVVVTAAPCSSEMASADLRADLDKLWGRVISTCAGS
jgi:ribonuclease P protein component